MSSNKPVRSMNKDQLKEALEGAVKTANEVEAKFTSAHEEIKEINRVHSEIAKHEGLLKKLQEMDSIFDFEGMKIKIDTVERQVSEVEACHTTLYEPTKGLKARVEEIEKKINALAVSAEASEKKITGEDGYEQLSKGVKLSLDKILEQVRELQSEIFEDEEDKLAIKTQIENALGQVTKQCGEVDLFYNNLLVDAEGENSKEKISLRTQIAQHLQALRSIKQTMENLLPRAATTGLAYSYFDAKAYHGPTKPRKPEETHWFKIFFFMIGGYLKPTFFYAVFIFPIAFTIAMFSPVFLGVGIMELITGELPINPPISHDIDWFGVLFRFFVAAPMGLISLFGYKSIQRSRKLYEEYDHKQRVMETYTGFKKEVEKMGAQSSDIRHANELMDIVLETVRDKPSLIKPKAANNEPAPIGQPSNDMPVTAKTAVSKPKLTAKKKAADSDA